MTIITQCDSCGKKFRIPPQHAGIFLPCKNCGEDMYVDDGGGERLSRPGSGGQNQASSGTPPWVIWAAAGAGVVVLLVSVVMMVGGGGDSESDETSSELAANDPASGNDMGSPSSPRPTSGRPGFQTSGAGDEIRPPGVMSAREKFEQRRRESEERRPEAMKNRSSNSDENKTEPEKNSSLADLKEMQDRLENGLGGSSPSTQPSQPLKGKVVADPPPEEIAYTPPEKNIRIKQSLERGAVDGVIVPKSFSPFMAVPMGRDYAIYDLRTGTSVSKPNIQFENRAKPALSPDGKYFATTTGVFGNDGVAFYDVKAKKGLGNVSISDVVDLMFVGEQELLVLSEEMAHKIDVISGKVLDQFPFEYSRSTKTALSPGGRYLVQLEMGSGSKATLSLSQDFRHR